MTAFLQKRANVIIPLFWFFAFIGAVAIGWTYTPKPAWDTRVYKAAMHSLAAGRDPYADGIAAQKAHLAETRAHPLDMPPFSYPYSPVTLILLRALNRVRFSAVAITYVALYTASLIIIAMCSLIAAEPRERQIFLFLAPGTIFYPSLLESEVVLSGNIAYILYAVVLACAVLGWRKSRWLPFYLGVLIASCFKAPLLSLLAIAPLSNRRQLRPVMIAAATGLALFAVQPLFNHTLFQNYLTAVRLQFDYNHDFGLSPAGLLGRALAAYNLPYSVAMSAFYVLYASCVAVVLLLLARRFFRGAFSLQQWLPVMLLGVVLLNPRIKEYDVAILPLPMAFLTIRMFQSGIAYKRALLESFLFFLAVNGAAISNNLEWKPVSGCLLVGLFVMGAVRLWKSTDRPIEAVLVPD